MKKGNPSIRSLLLCIFCTLLPALVRQAKAETPNDRVVVMITIDGMAGFYLDDAKAELPNLRALAAEGARATSMKVSNPSVTWTNHTTLVTGVPPAVHGVLGNTYYDRAKRKRVRLIGDPVFDKDAIVKVPTIYDIAKAHSFTTAAVRWPATRNARSIDWLMPAMKAGTDLPYITPSLIEDADKAGVVFDNKRKDDAWCVTLFDYILTTHRPRLGLLHLVDTDHTQHLKGPRSAQAYATLKKTDEQVGKVWEVLKTRFPGRASLIVTSDHGFGTGTKTIFPMVLFRQNGLWPKDAKPAPVQVSSESGSIFIYILDQANREALLAKATTLLQGCEGVESVIGTDQFASYGMATPDEDPHTPDLVAFAKNGYGFSDSTKGQETIRDNSDGKFGYLGKHGYDADLPDLHGIFIAWGAGIRPGAKLGEINNTRVAPTLAKLLGITLPAPADAPLGEILEK